MCVLICIILTDYMVPIFWLKMHLDFNLYSNWIKKCTVYIIANTGWLMFLRKSKTRFIVEYCDWSHFKDYLLDDVVLEFHWSREIISEWNRPITKKLYFPGIFFIFWVYKRTSQDIETILTSFNVFLNYAYCVKISIFYSYFYCGKI